MSYSVPSQGHFRSASHDYNPSTPPPPPPKPGSGSQTPSRGPPLPPPPQQPGAQNSDHQGGYQGHVDPSAQLQITPPQPGWLPAGISDKSTQDLHHLVEHPELQAALLDNPATSHPSISQSQEPLKQLLESNVELSNSLLRLESQLLSLRSSTQSRLLSLRALEQQHRSKITETERELSEFSPPALYQRLNASAQEQDSLVKVTEESFLDEGGLASDREVQEFIRRVREVKKIAYLRNERKMRWDEGRVGGWR
ncbi:hypothetical protein BDZ85DRAFT_263029 [Elsinoe ampelina]|uniref:VPS37 C-terminal domain-containing protein n=1 Tax=Elsinoe ampelina TaxID=302913 RepID=A0A6A6GBM1_9PEZI|nr:hypothetical protein BDZ85DRAFT_263029 [Elsinoe ampelina]